VKIIYIAGPMTPRGTRLDTDNPAIEYLLNVRDLLHAAIAVIRKGWAPYCPGLDLQYFLSLPFGAVIPEAEIKSISMSFLEISDAILLLPRWESSGGTQKEYRRAVELTMPLYFSIDEVPDAN
jgi:hypothetical protein